MTALIQALVDAISSGAVYALAALGIGLIFGVMRLINFAHGEIITAAAYTLVLTWHLGWFVAIALCLVAAVLMAVVMDQVVFRHLRRSNPATMLIVSFGLSFLIQRIYSLVFGNSVLTAPVGAELAQSVQIGEVRVRMLSLVTIVVAAVLIALLVWMLTRTSIGLQLQAASTDMRTARQLGIRANRVIVIAFGVGGALAAAVGFVLTVQTGAVGPTFGVNITIMALMGAVIGGVSKLEGALAGGFIVGFALSILSSYLPPEAVNFRDAFVFLLVILVLLVKPAGIIVGRGVGART